MAIEGALQDVSLADICQLLGMGMKTGCLSITASDKLRLEMNGKGWPGSTASGDRTGKI